MTRPILTAAILLAGMSAASADICADMRNDPILTTLTVPPSVQKLCAFAVYAREHPEEISKAAAKIRPNAKQTPRPVMNATPDGWPNANRRS